MEARAWRVDAAQQYQTIAGTLRMADKTLAISNGKLSGENISFNVGGVQYSGRVRGDAMDGTMAVGATRSPWSASRGR